MKTRVDYEASDIDIENNALHRFLDGSLAAIILVWTLLTMKKDEKILSDERLNKAQRTSVATFLTMLENSGWEIVKKESSIPQVFRDGLIEKD